MSNPVTFNAVDLDGITDFEITNYEFNLYPKRQLRNFKLANQNRSALTSAEYVDKEIIVYGIIRECTRATSEEVLKNLRAATQAIKKTLTVAQYNRTVSYTATLESMSEKWVSNNMMVTMQFYCEIPIGVDSVTESLIAGGSTNTTTVPKNYAVTFGGSALHQYPIITVDINSLTAGGGDTITIGNSVTGHELTITRSWLANDLIVVDTYQKSVTVNGTEVNYGGRIPEFGVGATNITYNDDFSARNVDVTAEYQRRYV